MQLLGLSAFLLLISSSYGQDNATLIATGIIGNLTSNTVIIAFPNACKYSLQQVQLNVNQVTQNSTFNFMTPQCRLKRDLVVISDSQSGNTETVNVGYQVTNLTANTQYTAYYVINNTAFTGVTFTTLNGLSNAPPTVFARSGGMVVITVLLSIAMFLLVIGLIVVLVLGGKRKK
ncbi:uroplakin-2 [Rana temporaria]|uniref:uroplakin-2 n=1 Tax=Rana temporaria TaxID=8407 RepID=UPI001AADA2A7|nr:uroplakin-2 [Rana temporaria]